MHVSPGGAMGLQYDYSKNHTGLQTLPAEKAVLWANLHTDNTF